MACDNVYCNCCYPSEPPYYPYQGDDIDISPRTGAFTSKPKPATIGRIDLGPTREEVDDLRRRFERLEKELENAWGYRRPSPALRREDV